MAKPAADLDDVLKRALALEPEARAALASELLESLDDSVDEDVEAAWRKELDERLGRIDRGETRPIPWDSARALIHSDDEPIPR
jgi:putative addiction module component (TIGR02574 family)